MTQQFSKITREIIKPLLVNLAKAIAPKKGILLFPLIQSDMGGEKKWS
jgi:hypothetical protein